MKININAKNLASNLGGMLAVVERTNLKPVLSNVLLETCQNSLRLSTTDADLYVSKLLPSRVSEEGSTTASARLLHDILRRLNDEEINLFHQTGEERLSIKGKDCEFHLSTIPSDQFPRVENFDPHVSIKLPSTEFANLLEETVFSVSNEETRYNLNGVCLHIREDSPQKLRAASTDCHRLSSSSYTLPVSCTPFEVIVPRKTVEEFIKLAKAGLAGEVELSLNDKLIRIVSFNTSITSKLVDGKFPEYSGLIPQQNPNKLTFDSEYLSEAIARVSTITTGAIEKFKTIQLNIGKSSMEISAHGNAYASAKERIKFSSKFSYQGEELAIGFNPKYLLDVTRAIGRKEAECFFGGALSPVVIRPKNSESSCFVVMPIKVNTSAV